MEHSWYADAVKQRWYPLVKRILDFFFAVALLIILSPLLLLIMLINLFVQGRPLFFCQKRPGRGGKPFTLIKFRTMRTIPGATDVDAVASDEQRLTHWGSLLRATSLDELPELINIACGQMSFVGPRPLLMAYLDLYSPTQARRHEVRPGLTGLAQVCGRNALTWKKRFELDVFYVDHLSWLLDIKILLHTVTAVLGHRGVAQEGQATVEPFRGNQEPPC